MYNLRVEVVEILGFCDQPMHVGDYFEVRGGRLYIPDGKYFCMWALQSVLPMLPAKQRNLTEENDWLKHTTRVSCPDPNGRVILELKQLDTSASQRATPPRRILVDEDACIGCRRCELVCSFARTGSYSRAEACIRVEKDDVRQIDRPVVCRQCGNAWCVESCPTGALSRDPDTHAVLLDRDKCIRCGTCAEACPFGSIRYDSQGYPLICDLCGGDPKCVAACPTGALSFGLGADAEQHRVARAMFGDFEGEA